MRRPAAAAALLPAALHLALCAGLACASHSAHAAAAAAERGGAPGASFSAASGAASARTLQGVAPQPDPPYMLETLPLQLIKLPPGFSISLYANTSIPARFFAVGNRGRAKPTIVYVSSNSGIVYALVDRKDGSPVTTCPLVTGLDVPNGVAYDTATGILYVSEVRRIRSYTWVDQAALEGCNATRIRARQVVGGDVLPEQAAHRSRGLGLGPDGRLYVTVAAPFNYGDCVDPYCSIMRMEKNGSNPEIFARGIRNAADFDWHAETKALVFSGMERDLMGDDRPDDILGAIYPDQAGSNLTWPYCHWLGSGDPLLRNTSPGSALADPNVTLPEFSTRPDDATLNQRCSEIAPPPLQALGPHVAPLGALYWSRTASLPAAGVQRWPAQWGNGFFSAQHGSWNRNQYIGYRVMHVELSEDGKSAVGHSKFAEGWLQPDGTAWGRPTGLVRLPDGSMLLGDDRAKVVYRISYRPPPPPASPRPPPPKPNKLPAGIYILAIADRPNCGGFLTGSSCQQALALTLRLRLPSLAADQSWSIKPAQAGVTTIEGAPVLLSTLPWAAAACRPTFYSLGYTSSSCTGGTLGAVSSRQQPVNGQWVLESGPGGAFYIRPKSCASKYLGLPRGCAAGNRVGLYAKGGAASLLWRLTKA
ncbi:hypothetical protein ABPG75_002880 [Micractinium tetrahymenae]